MITLVLCFFICIVAFANTDASKFKEVTGAVKDAFGVQTETLAWGKEQGGKQFPIKLEGTAMDEAKARDAIVNLLQQSAKEEGLDKNILISMDKRGVRMDIMETGGSAMFNPGGTEILPESKRLLRKMIPIMQETPYRITIEGHSDDIPVSTPQYPSNWELSSARAGSVVRYFIEEGKLQAPRFTAVGRAETQPIVPNDNPGNRSKNRRVSIIYELF